MKRRRIGLRHHAVAEQQAKPALEMAPGRGTSPILQYAVVLEPDEDTVRVIVPAFPEISTFGNDRAHALEMAADAIALSIDYRRDRNIEIPAPDGHVACLEIVSVAAA